MKRILVITLIACTMVASIAAVCSAEATVVSKGYYHANDAYQPDGYDLAWGRVKATGRNYTVTVAVDRNGTLSGFKNSTASAGYTTYCTSYKVPGSGATGSYVVPS